LPESKPPLGLVDRDKAQKVRRIGARLRREALRVRFNVQLLARDGAVKVIECNLGARAASRLYLACGQDLIRRDA
jgi:predicted ATP-grasp superfamily ATP-dependent carboligase